MKSKTLLILSALALVSMALTGCHTMADAVKAKGTGEKVVYQVSFDRLWMVMPGLINQVGLQLVKADRTNQMVLARRGESSWSAGEDVAIFIEKIDENKTQVEVDSKKVMSTNVGARNWAPRIFRELDELYKRG